MLGNNPGQATHEKYKELCALAGTNSLTAGETSDLDSHLDYCHDCREVARQYLILMTKGIPSLAVAFEKLQDPAGWYDRATRQELLRRVRREQESFTEWKQPAPVVADIAASRSVSARLLANVLLAACLLLGVSFVSYRLGVLARPVTAAAWVPVPADSRPPAVFPDKNAADQLIADQAKKITQLQGISEWKEQEVSQLRAELRAVTERASQLEAANRLSADQVLALSQQRDALNAQLLEANQSYQNVRTELASLRSERDKNVLHTNSLEAKVDELSTINHEQESRLKDAEQFLTSDRDIRELMGARKLYIADVFDVDSGSQTRKPFGRVFYTVGKSLIFYAFDLDRQPGAVNANTFQVWGQRESAQGAQGTPTNLGILYLDNESNRRWALRFDDPKQLTEIEAVFVTVEPRGGSHKPTGKPFLYALLRNDVNHP